MTIAKLVESVGSRHYYVVTSKAKMPSSVKSSYLHSAVVAVDGEPIAPKERMWDLARDYAEKRRKRLAREADSLYLESLSARSGEEV